MDYGFRKLMRRQIQENLDDPAMLMTKPVPRGGWLRLMRKALGMTTYQLAKRLNCSRPNITALERREELGTVSLEVLDSAAKAMHCRLVYFLVPEKPLEKLLENRARLVAKNMIEPIEHSMELEGQGLSHKHKKQQEQDLVQELLWENPKKLWED